MARSDAHSISAATSLGSVADDLRRSYNREEQDFGSLALFIEVCPLGNVERPRPLLTDVVLTDSLLGDGQLRRSW